METIKKLWNNFKSRPDIWFFTGFLLTFTMTVRKVLFYFPTRGEFNEFTGVYLYASDIFLVFTLLFWVISILRNKIDYLSIGWIQNQFRRKIIYVPLLLVIWSFLSIIWSENHTIALFRSIKLSEFYLLFIYIFFNFSGFASCKVSRLPRGEKMFHAERFFTLRGGTPVINRLFKILLVLIISLGVIHSVVAIGQFLIQQSVGLQFLKESIISPDLPGVAKILVGDVKMIRSYGLFPHPNILGGFLILSLFISFFTKKMVNKVSSQKEYSTPVRMFHVEHPTGQAWNIHINSIIWNSVIIVQVLAIILTFSKSAILALILGGLLYLTSVSPRKNCSTPAPKDVPRGTFLLGWNISLFYGVEHYLKNKTIAKGFIIALIFVIVLVVINFDFQSFLIKSSGERLTQINFSPLYLSSLLLHDISNLPGVLKILTFGVGMGQFIPYLSHFVNLETWQIQPIHNVYLMVLNELGIIGLFLFIYMLVHSYRKLNIATRLPRGGKMFHMEHFSTLRGGTPFVLFLKSIFLAILFIMFFDHYFWDIQQGQAIFWMLLGFAVSIEE